MKKLEGVNVAVLATNGFEEVELTKPVEALKEAGATVAVVSPEEKIRAWDFTDWGDEYEADLLLEKANPDDFDALLLPGGVLSPDELRINNAALDFVRHFVFNNKPIAAICHGPWLLAEIGYTKDKKLTSYPAIRTDMINAGAHWVNKEVVTDGLLVTSRQPDDIPAFNQEIVNVFEREIVNT